MRQWTEADEQTVATPGHRFGAIYYIAPLVNAVVVTIATALIVAALGSDGVSEAKQVGLVVGLAAAAISVPMRWRPIQPVRCSSVLSSAAITSPKRCSSRC